MPVLLKVTGEPPGQLFELKEETLIGRLPKCDIVLDPNGVSREHAKIRRHGGAYYLIDLNSRNKTKLNERE
ncbi:MAG: FHA domain-containing protein, partial [Isosphaeraceae bacterium]|nr:FHA domain-containing protein [Isosphaeraceae bacterium]